eukprot:8460005-Alexandrium_andersonii.AAC.1
MLRYWGFWHDGGELGKFGPKIIHAMPAQFFPELPLVDFETFSTEAIHNNAPVVALGPSTCREI